MSPIYWLGYQTVGLFGRFYFRMDVRGREHVPKGPCLVVANHVSFLDPPLVGWSLRREMYYMARHTLFKPPVLHWLLPRINVIPVNRDQADLATLRRILEVVRNGHGLLLFPEGTRSPDGTLQPAKAGAGWMACKANVPILPVRISGSYEAWPKNQKLPLPRRVRVSIGRPFLPPAEFIGSKDKASYQALSDRMMAEIAALE